MGELLWHYTNAAGVLGILTSHEMWASNIEFMNDATENNRLRELVSQRISSRLQSEQHNPPTAPDEMASHLAFFSRSGQSLFVASFSECPDSLSQWRAYGNFAIGFSKSSLMKLNYDPDINLGHGARRMYFGPVRYYSKAKDEELVDHLARTSMGETADTDLIPDNFSSKELRWLTPRFKDESFSEEKEWRLICYGNVDYIGMEFRPGMISTITPYIKVNLENVNPMIEEIRVGPGTNCSLNEKALNLFKDARHWQFAVSKTAVPFRNW